MTAWAELESQMQRHYYWRKLVNAVACFLLFLAACFALASLGGVFGYLIYRGLPSANWALFTALPTPVGEAGGGMANAFVGSGILVLLASLVGVPLGIFTGIYLSEYGLGKLAASVRFSVDMLSSIPSIVVGLFIYVVLVRPMHRFSALAGGAALAILMIPTVARTTEELLKVVPQHIREAGLALGIPRWKVIMRVVVRGSLSGILVGVMLAIGRVAGETAPLLFTALNNRFWHRGLDQPIASLPVQIYTYAIAPFEDWNRQAWSAALFLVVFVLVINVVTRWLLRRAIASSGEGVL